jgi:peptidoglycan/xylan/chitin deacetylase (PgdA/CDA1 family)
MSPRRVIRGALVPLSRILTRRKPRVLMYHRFGLPGQFRRLPIDVFEEQLRFLQENYSVVPLKTIVSGLVAGEALPARAVALTVDDAYDDFHRLAYPLIEKYRVPVTLYVVSAFADATEWLWMDKIQHLIRVAPAGRYEVPVNGVTTAITLESDESRATAWELCADYALGLRSEARQVYLRDLERCMGLELPAVAPEGFRSVDWDALRGMDPELVEVGCHSMTHPILSLCSPEQQENEIAGAKTFLESRLQRRVTSFCYPNGTRADYDENCVNIARRAGFTHAVTACGGYVDSQSKPFEMPRVGAPTSVEELKCNLDGVSWLVEQADVRRMFAASTLGLATANSGLFRELL